MRIPEPREEPPMLRLFQLLLLTTATFVASYARGALGPLQEAMRIGLELTDNETALLQGPALAIPMALGSIPIGLLVDRYQRARLFIAFAAMSLTGTALTAFAPSFALLFVARCLAGFGAAGTLVTTFSVLSDLYRPAQRGRATTVMLFGEVGGAPAAFALGGILLATSGAIAGVGVEGWRWALLWMCAPLLPAALLTVLLREPARTGVVVQNLPMREAWAQLWRYRALIAPLLLARIMVWIADGAVLVWAAPNFARNFDLPPDRIGTIMGVALFASGILGPILGGPLADLCQRGGGPRRTVLAMSIVALVSAPAGLFSIMGSTTVASVMLGVFLTLGYTIATLALALASIVIPGELRGLFISISVTTAATFSIGVAPMVVSSLSGALGGPTMIGQALAAVCATTSVVGAVVFGIGRPYFPAR